MEIEMKKFNAKRLKDRMVRRGMNQTELARRMDMTISGVNYWVHAKQRPNVKRVARLAKVLGVKVDYFFQPEREVAGAA